VFLLIVFELFFALRAKIYEFEIRPLWGLSANEFFELYEFSAMIAVFPLLAVFVYYSRHSLFSKKVGGRSPPKVQSVFGICC
jgi:hypothetical protein